MNSWNNEIQKAMAHDMKRRIIECLQDRNMSFAELLNAVGESNHGKFGYHLRTLKGFAELEPSTRKYCLTHRGRLLAACIQDFRFITSRNRELTKYVKQLRLGDHAFVLYDTEVFKRKVSFPFLEAGLLRGEAVIYIVSEHRLDSERREIRRYGISDDYFRTGAFTFMSANEWYLKKGRAQAKTIIANWQTLAREKQKATPARAAFTGLRAAGEMEVFFDHAKIKELLSYEVALGRQLPPNICGMCLYDTSRLNEKQFIKVHGCHGYLISRETFGKTIV